VLLTLRRYALDDHVISDVADPFVYWARLDIIVVIWILDALSPELHEIIREPTKTHGRHGSQSRLNFSATTSRVFCISMLGSASSSKATLASATTVIGWRAWPITFVPWVRLSPIVINLLQSLNKRFDHMKIFIKRSQSFPSFHTICNDLELEEIELDNSVA
jgi:hypothetical protein